MRVVEEAIARQVLHGGDLATNVLELGAVRERELTALLAESVGLPPAVGRLRPASPEVLRTIPVDLAVEHRVFPLDVRTDLEAAAIGAPQPEATLVIATAEPLAPAAVEKLSVALGVNLRQLAAPLVRIRQALAEHYGIALERRLSRLVKQLDARAEPSPAEAVEPGSAAAAAPPPGASPLPTSPAGAGAASTAGTAGDDVTAPGEVEVAPPARIEAASPAGVEAASPADVDATSPADISAASPAGADDHEEAVETQGQKRPSIDDAPTVEARTSIYDDDTVVAEVALNEAVPTPRKPPLHELDDEPTVVAQYPLDLRSFRNLEAHTPRVEALASRLAELAPQRGRGPAAPARETTAAAGPHEEAAHPGQTAATDEEPAIEPAEPTPRSEELAPRLAPFAASGAVHEVPLVTVTEAPAQAALAPPIKASAPPAPAPSSPRPPAGNHLLTGWLKRASAVHRAQQDTLPQAAASPQHQPSGAASPAPAPVALAPVAHVVAAPVASAPVAHAPVAPAPVAPAHGASAPAASAPAAERRERSSSAPAANGAMRAAGRSAPAAQRRKGPFTLAMAEQELAAVDASEAVLAVLFDFAQQYFEYTVLFTVHGERAEGRNAAGPGAERERVAKIAVPLDRPCALARARTLRAPLVTSLAGSAPDAELQRELGRAVHAAAVAVVPVVVRGRVVALVYGDDGASSVELSSIGDLIALAGLAATVLERLILRKKLNRGGAAQQRDSSVPHEIAVSPHQSAAPPPHAAAPSPEAAAPPPHAAAPPPEASAPGDEHAKEGPLSLRTRAALMELRHMVRAEAHGSPAADAGTAPPAGHADPGAGEPRRADSADVEPHGMRPQGGWSTEDGGSGIDAVARAFGLRGTGVETEPVQPDEGAAHAMAFSSTIPPAPMPHAPTLGIEPHLRLGLEAGADVVSGTAVTAPMMPAVTEPMMPAITGPTPAGAIDEIPDLEIPAAPAPSPSEDLDLSEPEEGRTRRYSRPPWMLDSSITPGADEHRDLGPAPAVGRSSWRRRTPAAVESAVPHVRPPSERRAAVSPSASGDLRAEYTSLLQHVLAGGEAGARAFAELVRHGETAVSVIAARFPGPLRVERQRFREQLAGPDGAAGVAAAPPASQCGPLLELIVAIRRPALPFMTVRSASPDPEVRFWATHVLGELPYPEAANALLPRLFDDNIAVRRIAVRSAAQLIAAPPAGGPILQGLDHIARDREEAPARRLTAIDTMAEIRSGSVVPALMSALTDPHEAIVDAAARALVVITRDDHGRDARRWASWWSRNADRHRIEWIIDALTHEKPAIRRAAIDELKGITKEYFGYYEDLPRQEREAAQERYRAWWSSEGRSRFRTTG
ncbi:HEAT repeat domain-containing protein [Sorangium sp. So ce1128]